MAQTKENDYNGSHVYDLIIYYTLDIRCRRDVTMSYVVIVELMVLSHSMQGIADVCVNYFSLSSVCSDSKTGKEIYDTKKKKIVIWGVKVKKLGKDQVSEGIKCLFDQLKLDQLFFFYLGFN